jgi:tRNA1Val (adenine37-N6)-methyltransferase
LIVLADLQIRQEEGGLDVSVDSLFSGRLVCRQPRQGYRFSIDAILLAHFSPVRAGDSVLDMGCGCGIIGLILMFRWRMLLHNLVGLELQPELAELARENSRLNGFDHKFTVVEGDLRNIGGHFRAESFTRVFCNPPFYTSESGRENVNRQSQIARHQVCLSTDQAMTAASFVVKNRGSVSVVFPADRLVELFGSMRSADLQPKRMQMVYSYPEQQATARLVLVEAIKNGGPGITILPSFYIYREKNGPCSDDMQRMYEMHGEQETRIEEKSPGLLGM